MVKSVHQVAQIVAFKDLAQLAALYRSSAFIVKAFHFLDFCSRDQLLELLQGAVKAESVAAVKSHSIWTVLR